MCITAASAWRLTAKPTLKHALNPGYCLCMDPAKSPELPGAACNERAQPLLPLLPETENLL